MLFITVNILYVILLICSSSFCTYKPKVRKADAM